MPSANTESAGAAGRPRINEGEAARGAFEAFRPLPNPGLRTEDSRTVIAGDYLRLDRSRSGPSREPVHVQRDERGSALRQQHGLGWKHLLKAVLQGGG